MAKRSWLIIAWTNITFAPLEELINRDLDGLAKVNNHHQKAHSKFLFYHSCVLFFLAFKTLISFKKKSY